MNGDMTLPPHLLHAAEAWGTTKRESTPSALDAIWHSNRMVLQMTNREVDKKRITNPHLLQVVRPRFHNSDDERSSLPQSVHEAHRPQQAIELLLKERSR
jgi:hypothetical protein